MAIKFVLVWFIVQLLHGDLVIPRVMGNRLQVHPITILIVLLVMGDLLGLMGVIFGIPIYTLIKLLVVFTFKKFKQRYNKYYGDQGVYQKAEFSEKDYFEKSKESLEHLSKKRGTRTIKFIFLTEEDYCPSLY